MSTHVIAMQQQNKRQAMGKLSDSYRTPPWLFKWLDSEYDFEFDICASDDNHLCEKYYTEYRQYNDRDWSELGSIGFCNPPFSHGQKELALENAYRNMVENKVASVFVIPCDIANDFWRTHIYEKATRMISMVGRVKFCDPITSEETKHGLGIAVVEFMPEEIPVRAGDFEIVLRDEVKKCYNK